MGKLAGLGVAIWLVLAVPVAAQDDAPPSFVNRGGMERADPDKSPARRAREEAEAGIAEAACNAGDLTGCAALGKAYMYGEGKPQNRPAAYVLLRRACDGGEATGCLGLGNLHWRIPELSAQEFAVASYRRGCELGSLDACEREAETIEKGLEGTPGDPAAADAFRQEICPKGGVAACRSLAIKLFAPDRSPAEQAEGQAVLDRQCRAGEREACVPLASWRADQSNPLTPFLREILSAGCAAGEADHCTELAGVFFAESSGPPAQRSEAIALYERACELKSSECTAIKAIHAQPPLAEACSRGERDACTALGTLYAKAYSPLQSPVEAATLLGDACEAGDIAQCGHAVGVQLYNLAPLTPDGIARADRWYMIGCDGGSNVDCKTLGIRLIDGDLFPPDRARGYGLLERACERDDTASCDELVKRGKTDPDALLPVADSRFIASLEEGEEDPRVRRLQEEERAKSAALRARSCTSTTVTLDGVTYHDTICSAYVRAIRGFASKAGQTPWQALLWRPETLNPGTRNALRLTPADQVVCGGSVIRTGWILTAAHCLTDDRGNVIPTAGYRVRLGLSNPYAEEGLSYPILRVIPHPKFCRTKPCPRSLDFDVALVQYDPARNSMSGRVFPVSRIRLDPLPLAARKTETVERVFTYGWGRTEVDGGSIPDHLRGARVKLRDAAACTKATRFTDSERRDTVLCADERVGAGGGQACKGDSGGPLITYGDTDQRPTLIGVVSGGAQCGSIGKPSRYVRVAHPAIISWINKTLPPDSRR